jgi:hypothetical protein
LYRVIGSYLIAGVGLGYRPKSCALGMADPVGEDVRRWHDGVVVRLAAAVAAGDVAAGILADALLGAGCANDELMAHLRRGKHHPHYCWAIHSVLHAR